MRINSFSSGDRALQAWPGRSSGAGAICKVKKGLGLSPRLSASSICSRRAWQELLLASCLP